MSIMTFMKWSLCVLTVLGVVSLAVLLVTPWGDWMTPARMLGMAIWTWGVSGCWLLAECATRGRH